MTANIDRAKIDVVVFVNERELSLFSDFFSTRENVDMVLHTSDANKAKNTLLRITNPVLVLRVLDKNNPEILEMEAFCREKKIVYMCICCSASDGFDLLHRGAATMVTRNESEITVEFRHFEGILHTKIREAYRAYFEDSIRVMKAEHGAYSKVIAIGSSTGGTETVLKIMKELPKDCPPILIVQHMPPVFTKLYAERLNMQCKMSVWEAKDGDVLKRGLCLLAPGDFQMTVEENSGGGLKVRVDKGERVSGHCPSVDVLFDSMAKVVGKKGVGVILTGMGSDGAKGMLNMRKNGAYTLGQDEPSCVVYGMPKAAFELGAVNKQVSIEEMARAIIESTK